MKNIHDAQNNSTPITVSDYKPLHFDLLPGAQKIDRGRLFEAIVNARCIYIEEPPTTQATCNTFVFMSKCVDDKKISVSLGQLIRSYCVVNNVDDISMSVKLFSRHMTVYEDNHLLHIIYFGSIDDSVHSQLQKSMLQLMVYMVRNDNVVHNIQHALMCLYHQSSNITCGVNNQKSDVLLSNQQLTVNATSLIGIGTSIGDKSVAGNYSSYKDNKYGAVENRYNYPQRVRRNLFTNGAFMNGVPTAYHSRIEVGGMSLCRLSDVFNIYWLDIPYSGHNHRSDVKDSPYAFNKVMLNVPHILQAMVLGWQLSDAVNGIGGHNPKYCHTLIDNLSNTVTVQNIGMDIVNAITNDKNDMMNNRTHLRSDRIGHASPLKYVMRL